MARPEATSPPAETCAPFSWDAVRAELHGLGDGGRNIADEAVDRHARSDRAGQAALILLDAAGGRRVVDYRELAALSDRFGHVLRGLGVIRGDIVFVLCERSLPLYVAVLGALKIGAVAAPLYQAFGPEAIAARVGQVPGALLVTGADLYRRKIAALRARLPGPVRVLLVDAPADALPADTFDMTALMRAAPARSALEATRESDPALLHFTSGTTGTPKGALHVHGAVLGLYASARQALDLAAGDVFWCTADPGWVTGTAYGIVAPLVHGATCVVDAGGFDAARWYDILAGERVAVWYTAPTALRMLIRAGEALAARHRYPALRRIASVGEPLDARAVRWGAEVFGRPIHDTWWQTETGAIMIANGAPGPLVPGAMGRPLPGIEAAVVHRRAGGGVDVLEDAEAEGELALRAGWPSMFRAYLGQPERYRACFAGDWYLSGDLVRRDAAGDYWFLGRRDDLIKSAGHLVGPCEVERVLMAHPAVAEAGVIGLPDALIGESVKAFVALRQGCAAGEALRRELLAHARRALGAAVAPREIAFVDRLPHTRSGKIMRRLLRARELGLPEGDTSTLEEEGQ